MENYNVKKGVIYSENGLPYAPRMFCDGRVVFEANNDSLGEIDYFSAKTNGSFKIFRNRFWGGISFFKVKNGSRTKIKPQNTEIWPFGYISKGDYGKYSFYTANENIYFVFELDEDADLEMQFYDEYLFVPDNSTKPDVRLRGPERVWAPIELKDNKLIFNYHECDVDNEIIVSSNAKLGFKAMERNGKYILSAEQVKGNKIILCMSFKGSDYADYQKDFDAQIKRYTAVAEKAPVLHSQHKILNQFMQLAPMYHESLKTPDFPGAIRAQTTCYWVWGWDSMTCNNSCMYWGDQQFIGDMLKCFMENATDKGIAHAFSRDMSCGSPAPATAQGMYLTLLDLYRLSGGDVKPYYDFAKKLIKMILDTEVGDTGLCIGLSLYPDFRNLIRENHNDISCFNNTVSYCAARSMERIAESVGDTETANTVKAFADRNKKNFLDVLYNEEMKFIDSSSDIDGYKRRFVPTNNAVKWESNDCRDLIWEKSEECLDFYLKNLVSESGIRPLPEWSDVYDSDSNQLHCWWSVMSEFYTRLINAYDKPDYINKYVGWLEYWNEKLMCPEGISCYDNIKEVPYDNWNARIGTWQGYNIRGFYDSVIHAVIGLDFDKNGMNFYPYSGEEMTIEKLHFGEKLFKVEMKGSGKSVKSVILNGKELGAVASIPFEKLEANNEIVVVRG